MGPFTVHYNSAQFVENCVGSNTNVKVILYEIYKLETIYKLENYENLKTI